MTKEGIAMKRLRQIVAWISVFVLIGLIMGTVVCAVTGSPYFFGMLFLMLVIPVILWVFMWFTRLMNGDSDVISKEEMQALKAKEASEMGNGAGEPTPQIGEDKVLSGSPLSGESGHLESKAHDI